MVRINRKGKYIISFLKITDFPQPPLPFPASTIKKSNTSTTQTAGSKDSRERRSVPALTSVTCCRLCSLLRFRSFPSVPITFSFKGTEAQHLTQTPNSAGPQFPHPASPVAKPGHLWGFTTHVRGWWWPPTSSLDMTASGHQQPPMSLQGTQNTVTHSKSSCVLILLAADFSNFHSISAGPAWTRHRLRWLTHRMGDSSGVGKARRVATCGHRNLWGRRVVGSATCGHNELPPSLRPAVQQPGPPLHLSTGRRPSLSPPPPCAARRRDAALPGWAAAPRSGGGGGEKRGRGGRAAATPGWDPLRARGGLRFCGVAPQSRSWAEAEGAVTRNQFAVMSEIGISGKPRRSVFSQQVSCWLTCFTVTSSHLVTRFTPNCRFGGKDVKRVFAGTQV